MVFPGGQERTLREFFLKSAQYAFDFQKLRDIDLDRVDRLILVDVRQSSRIGPLDKLAHRPGVALHIYDHHPDTTADLHGEVEHVRAVGSTVTVLTHLFMERCLIPGADEATMMMLGLYEDTGSLTFATTTSADYQAAAFLLEHGADLNVIASMLAQELTPDQVRLLNDLLANRSVLNVHGIDISITHASVDYFVGDIAALAHKLRDIENLDARVEWFTPAGGLLSAGAFLKWLTNPIEKFNAGLDPAGNPNWTSSSDFVTFLNTDEATLWGFEVEARHNLAFIDSLLEPFSLGMNFAWIVSQVDVQPAIQELKYITTGERVTSRPLYDQSPYILNADLSYENRRTGTTVSVVGYYAAERLALIVNNGWDVYEQGVPQLDVVVSQALGRGFAARFSARNLLNPDIIRSYAVSGPTDTTYLYSSYTRGITFGLSLSYSY